MSKNKYADFTPEELREKIKQLEKKRYGLVWENKPEAVADRCDRELPVLAQQPDKEITEDPNGPTNLLIEGDNYHALFALNFTHRRKIDVIYIDPPYNTGAKDWKYNNDYVDIHDRYRHSKWLSMMHKRLVLAKGLLKRDGILIVTIDDNELFNLGNLLAELFPQHDNFIVTIEHNRRGRRGKNFAKTNEWAMFLVPRGEELIAEEVTETTIGGETRNLRRTGSGSKRHQRPRKFFPIWVNEKTLEIVRAGDPLPVDAELHKRRK